MRPSEQLALKKKDFDFTVYRGVVVGIEAINKTETGQRTIDMEPEVEAAVLRWLKIREKIKTKHDYLFCRPDGRELDAEYLNKSIWRKTLEKAELHPRKMYATRHTFATIALTEGRSPAWVAQMMGDRIETVLKHYFHFLPNLGGAINRAMNPPGF